MKTQDQQKQRLIKYAQSHIPLEEGNFELIVFQNSVTKIEHLVIASPEWQKEKSPFVRIHSECFTGEVLGSLKCDCKDQLQMALNSLAQKECGMVIYLRDQEGRGIGLGNKIKAYKLQDQGLNTIQANKALGFANDLRDFSIASEILKQLGIKSIKLNTNNPQKIAAIKKSGIQISQIIPSWGKVNNHNHQYLKTKQQELGHSLQQIIH